MKCALYELYTLKITLFKKYFNDEMEISIILLLFKVTKTIRNAQKHAHGMKLVNSESHISYISIEKLE